MAKGKKGFQKGNKEHEKAARGKNKRTLILEALERQGHTQEGFYDLLVKRALDQEDSFAFGELWKRFHPVEKATFPTYEFTFPEKGTKLQKADAIIDAIGGGIIPIDAGKMLMDIIKDASAIEELEDLSVRLEKLENLYEQSISQED